MNRIILIVDQRKSLEPKFVCRRGLDYNKEFWEKYFINKTYSTVTNIHESGTILDSNIHIYEVVLLAFNSSDLMFIRNSKYFDYYFLSGTYEESASFLKTLSAAYLCTI